jgi:hypothetical protein
MPVNLLPSGVSYLSDVRNHGNNEAAA